MGRDTRALSFCRGRAHPVQVLRVWWNSFTKSPLSRLIASIVHSSMNLTCCRGFGAYRCHPAAFRKKHSRRSVTNGPSSGRHGRLPQRAIGLTALATICFAISQSSRHAPRGRSRCAAGWRGLPPSSRAAVLSPFPKASRRVVGDEHPVDAVCDLFGGVVQRWSLDAKRMAVASRFDRHDRAFRQSVQRPGCRAWGLAVLSVTLPRLSPP
jgi:hypothetical protein